MKSLEIKQMLLDLDTMRSKLSEFTDGETKKKKCYQKVLRKLDVASMSIKQLREAKTQRLL